jgi:hypothetical protein
LTSDEIKENETRNQRFQQNTMEYDYVQKFLSPGSEFENDAFRTTTEIREYIITMSDRKAELKSLEKLGKTLVQLGFVKVSKRIAGRDHPVYGYYVN